MQLPIGEIHRLVFVQFGAGAEAVEQVEAQVSTQRRFEHFVISLASACGGYFGGAQQFVFEVNGSLSSHIDIVAEKRFSFITLLHLIWRKEKWKSQSIG